MISSLASGFKFGRRRGLFLSADKAAVYQWQQGRFGSAYLFDATKEGQGHFERYLRQTENTPFYMLVDVFEEEFRHGKIPHVFGRDRSAIIQLRQQRFFRNTRYCHAEIQGREAEGRRDDRVLLTAISNAGIIDPWLALLNRHKAPLAGIYSVPLFTSALLDLIPAPAAHMLIVSLQSISGLRQTLYIDRELKISRLAPLPRYGTKPYGPYIFGEVEKISRHINSLQPGGKNEPLHVYFLATAGLLQELAQEYRDSTELHYHLIDLHTLPESGNILSKVRAPFSDQFFMYKLLSRPPRNCYASSSHRRYFFMRRLRHLLLIASALLILSSVIWGGANLVNALHYRQRSLIAQNKAEFYAAHNRMARESLPKIPVAPTDLQLAVELSETLRNYKTTPLDTVRLLSKALERFPSIHVSDMQWAPSLVPDFNAAQGENALGAQDTAAYRHAGDYRFYQTSMIKGYVEPFDGNFRAAITLINEFAEILRSQKAVYDVSVISLPLDVSPSTSLEGDMQSSDESARFSMSIVLGIADEA